MDQYLQEFIDYLKTTLGDKLAGVLIYGSYTKGYFDTEKSDYDIFILFQDEVVELREEIHQKFPKISVQWYTNLAEFKQKIVGFGWNTFIAFIYTGKLLYTTPELLKLRDELSSLRYDFKKLDSEHLQALLAKLKRDTEVARNEREGFELNKYLHSSLIRKLQILIYIRTAEIVVEFPDLIAKLDDKFITENLAWLSQLEATVFKRSSELLTTKEAYVGVLEAADVALAAEAIK